MLQGFSGSSASSTAFADCVDRVFATPAVKALAPFDWHFAQRRLEHDVAVLHGIDWSTYSRLLRAFQSRRRFRLTYDRGGYQVCEHSLSFPILADGRGKPDWEDDWKKPATGAATLMVDLAALGGELDQQLKQHPNPALAAFAPIWRKGRKMVISATVERGLALACTT